MKELRHQALLALLEPDPPSKCLAAHNLCNLLRTGAMVLDTEQLIPEPPGVPGHPERPELIAPHQVPRRGAGSAAGRAALLHAVAHIEFNAILAKLKEDQAEKEANYQYFRSVFQHLSIGLIT